MNIFKLHVYQKQPRNRESIAYPIYIRITIGGKRAEISTKREWDPLTWDVKAGRAEGKSDKAKELNVFLDRLVARMYNYQDELWRNNLPITAEAIKNKFTGKADKSRMLVSIFEHHNKEMKQLVDKEYAPATLNRYETSLKHVTDFMQWKFGISDIEIRKLNHEFITDFNFYLRTVRNCNNNSAVKYITNFRKIIRICISNGWLDKDPFINFKVKIKEVERIYLTDEELQILHDKVFIMKRLNEVKDIFLFSCYTGLAYIDTKNLTRANIVVGIDGNKWIHTHRKKTDSPSHIPLLPPAQEIIDKYLDNPKANNEQRLLPVLSNQKMNAYLKEIGLCCGINKDFTCHAARHTFATTVTLSNNVPIESVSKMLGHKNLRTTQHYAKILDKKVSNDMHQLHAIYSGKNKPDTQEKKAK